MKNPNINNGGYAWIGVEPNWTYKHMEFGIWRIFPEGKLDDESAICELWTSGNYDAKKLCQEICAAHNGNLTPDGMQILVLQPSGVEILIKPREDGKWEMVDAKHFGEEK